MGSVSFPRVWYAAEGGWYYNNGLMLFPPMALIIVGCIIWCTVRAIRIYRKNRR